MPRAGSQRTMVEQEDLEHSLALAGIQRNYNGRVFKHGAAKTFEEKVRVAQMWIDMNAIDSYAGQFGYGF